MAVVLGTLLGALLGVAIGIVIGWCSFPLILATNQHVVDMCNDFIDEMNT